MNIQNGSEWFWMVVFSGAMMSGGGSRHFGASKKGWREKVWWRLVRWSKEWHHQKNWIDLHHTPGVDFRTRESIRANSPIKLTQSQNWQKLNEIAIAYQIREFKKPWKKAEFKKEKLTSKEKSKESKKWSKKR